MTITLMYLPLLETIVSLKSKKNKERLLSELARNRVFRKCIREIIKNLTERKNEIGHHQQLAKFNKMLTIIMGKNISKKLKANQITKLSPFLEKVIPFIRKMVNDASVH